jgi:hypothetical protein
MASGQKSKISIIGAVVDEREAMPFLLPTGQLCDEVDLDIFTKNVPFQVGYDRCYAVWAPDVSKRMDDSITSEESDFPEYDRFSSRIEKRVVEWQEAWV